MVLTSTIKQTVEFSGQFVNSNMNTCDASVPLEVLQYLVEFMWRPKFQQVTWKLNESLF